MYSNQMNINEKRTGYIHKQAFIFIHRTLKPIRPLSENLGFPNFNFQKLLKLGFSLISDMDYNARCNIQE